MSDINEFNKKILGINIKQQDEYNKEVVENTTEEVETNKVMSPKDYNEKENGDIEINKIQEIDVLATVNNNDIVTTKTLSELENKLSEKSVNIWFYNFIPYLFKKVLNTMNGLSENLKNIDGVDSIANLITGPGVEVAQFMSTLRYFTLAELAIISLQNYYTMMFFKGGVGVKLGKEGFLGMSMVATESWDGSTVLTLKGDNVKAVNSLKEQRRKLELGGIYVYGENITNSENRFFIPFQFNASIQDGGITAKYNAQEVLGRIGELQSFGGTSGTTITLETSYYATHLNNDDEFKKQEKQEKGFWENVKEALGISEFEGEEFDTASFGLEQMKRFSLENLQTIERGYRSLVYPHSKDSEEGGKNEYYAPPVVKVQVGNFLYDDGMNSGMNGIYNGLLSYMPHEVEGKEVESTSILEKPTLKTFIVTNLTINKNEKEIPYYISNNGEVLDLMGFDVSLSLTEVSPTYAYSLPDFKDRMNFITRRGDDTSKILRSN